MLSSGSGAQGWIPCIMLNALYTITTWAQSSHVRLEEGSGADLTPQLLLLSYLLVLEKKIFFLHASFQKQGAHYIIGHVIYIYASSHSSVTRFTPI